MRRRLRLEFAQARSDSENGELDDATLAEIVARAIAAALGWHAESPQHTRNATASSRGWRPAGGPRGGPPRDFDDERPPRSRDYDERPPRRDYDDGRPPRPREYDDASRPQRPPYRPRYGESYGDEDYRPPRPRGGPPQYQQRGPKSGGRRPPPSRGGGFGPRKPRRNG